MPMPSVASLRSYLASNNVGTLPPQHCEYALDTTKRASALLTAPECRPGRGNAAHGASRWSTVSGIREADGHLAPPMFTANPPRSGATDFRNVVWEAGHLHLHLRADDSASREHAAALQYMLPNEALASNTKEPPVHTPDVLRVVATPATCSVWRNASVFFFRPSNPSLWHIYAEYILPIVNTMYADGGSGPERRLYVIPNNDVLSNKHWAHFFAAIGGVGVAADLFDSSRKCFNHLTWGIGVKNCYADRMPVLRRNVADMRTLMLGAELLAKQQRERQQPPRRVYISRGSSGHRRIVNVDEMRRWLAIDETCCDFAKPLAQMLPLLASAEVAVTVANAPLLPVSNSLGMARCRPASFYTHGPCHAPSEHPALPGPRFFT